MGFVSPRGQASPATLTEALRNGAAPDGGLYMPQELPAANLGALVPEAPLSEFAAALLRPFFAGDALEPELPAICAEALDFTAPLVTPNAAKPRLQALELFHGPTGAFKDFGARFLMACFGRIADASPFTVLAATSGDTGGAGGRAARRGPPLPPRRPFPHGWGFSLLGGDVTLL